MKFTIPQDLSSGSISEILESASGDAIFLADPRVRIEPGPAMFERMTRAIQRSSGLVYSDSENHPRID
ncbi:MAG TPA: hypothetical protein VFE29_03995, partial [Terriglobia bacterium]|nr:hypothetical protein [Terriglobia bacterium]